MTFVKGGPCYRLHPVWTKEMDEELINMIGSKSYADIAQHFGKSVEAVRKRARALGHRMDQGTTTLRELSRETGYNRSQLRRAKSALRLSWKRATNRKLLITFEQATAMVKYLANDRWHGRARDNKRKHNEGKGEKGATKG